MMKIGARYRMGRIERLLQELQYEVTRGIMDREIDEESWFRFVVPVSTKFPDGVVLAELPRLSVVKNEEGP